MASPYTHFFFFKLGALGSSVTNPFTHLSYLLHPVRVHSLWILSLKCLLNPPIRDCCWSSTLFGSWPFFFSFNLSPVYYLYPNYGSLWDVLGPFPFSVSMDRTVGYKIDQVFQSFLMWQCASEFPVMIYFSQTKNIPSNKIWKHPWGPGQGICALWTHWEEKWADTFPVPTSYLQTRIIVMW